MLVNGDFCAFFYLKVWLEMVMYSKTRVTDVQLQVQRNSLVIGGLDIMHNEKHKQFAQKIHRIYIRNYNFYCMHFFSSMPTTITPSSGPVCLLPLCVPRCAWAIDGGEACPGIPWYHLPPPGFWIFVKLYFGFFPSTLFSSTLMAISLHVHSFALHSFVFT